MRRVRMVGAIVALGAAGLTLGAGPEPRRAHGSRPWIGVMLRDDPAPEEGAGEAQEGSPPGVLVVGIFKDGPADRAGLRAQDRIVALDGSAVRSVSDLMAKMQRLSPMDWIQVSIRRGELERDLRVRVEQRPPRNAPRSLRRGWIGIEAIELPWTLRVHFGAPEEAGVMISGIEPGSPAEAAGFELGDVVYEVQGEPVRTPEELVTRIGEEGIGNSLEFTLARDGVGIVIEAVVGEAPMTR
jgi:serine protease Do